METLQIRLTGKLVEHVDAMVAEGLYANRSDVIRDAVRQLAVQRLVGMGKQSFDASKTSVEEVKDIRTKLSSQRFDLDEINRLLEK